MIIDYTKIKFVQVHKHIIEEIFEMMREFGDSGREIFVLLLGEKCDEQSFVVSNYVIPNQYHYESHSGIGVYIPPEEIEAVNRVIHESLLFPLGQIHSHPNQAYHSKADNEMSMIKSYGQFSIVVPYFANGVDVDFLDLAVFRLQESGKWKDICKRKKRKLFKVIEYDG